MDYDKVVGQASAKAYLQKTIENKRVPHAQLIVGPSGSGKLPLAVAYARDLLSSTFPEGSPQKLQCQSKVDNLQHPDLHFVYPVNTNERIKKDAVSDDFADLWREFVLKHPYGSLFDWLRTLGIENKQGNISRKEAREIGRKLILKPYEGGFKVMIIWMAEKMNAECSNTILKLLEEPPAKTALLLLAENEEQIISTIRSRCQVIHLPAIGEDEISHYLQQHYQLKESEARQYSIQAQGDLNKAIHFAESNSEDRFFEEWFVNWVRAAYKAKNNKQVINELIAWSEGMASEGRETQKKFVLYCSELFRQAMLLNYGAGDLVYFRAEQTNFDLQRFAPFVHESNILAIQEAIEKAYYHLSRNGNSKLIFSDLSIQLTRLIHKRSAA